MIVFPTNPFPELVTPRLVLRRMEAASAPGLFALRRDPEVMRYVEREPPETIAEIEELISQNEQGLQNQACIAWSLWTRESPRFCGTIGYWRMQPEHDRAEVGYMLARDWWGKGLASEALQAALEYGFQSMGMHSVSADVNPDNSASIRLLERHGFVREAYFRENFLWRGNYLDSAVFGLLKQDWERHPTRAR